MGDEIRAEPISEQPPVAATEAAGPSLSAEATAAYDPSTKPEVSSSTPVPSSEPPTELAGQPGPVRHKSLSFLQPGSFPGSLGRLGHFEVLELLGKGGFGIVLKAFDDKLQRLVAIKVLGPQLTGSADARNRFVREARLTAGVNNKYVVSIYEVFEQPVPYLVMEYVGGKSLQDRLDRLEPFAVRDILRIGTEIAKGLTAAHQQGLIHRDIKPANILLEPQQHGDSSQVMALREQVDSPDSPTMSIIPLSLGRVKIADFGLARAVDDISMTQSGVIAGTPLFMSPEQARGETLDPRSDLFSLGSVLYTLCTSHPPFQAHTTIGVMKRVCDDSPRSIRELNTAIPGSLVEIINRLLVKDPAGRIQTAAEVAELLQHQIARLEESAPPAAVGGKVMVPLPREASALDAVKSPQENANRRWTLRRWLATACVLLGVVACAAVLTESTGVTHWWPKSQPTSDPLVNADRPEDRGPPTEVIDPQSQLAEARRLAERGKQSLAAKEPAKAQADLEKARDLYKRLLASGDRWKNSERLDVLVALGEAYGQQGQTNEAVTAFVDALSLVADRSGRSRIIATAAPLKSVLETLAERTPGDGPFQAELARHFAERGNASSASSAFSRARTFFEAKLAKEPRDSAAATELGQLILDRQDLQNAAQWTVLKPTEIKSRGGATLKLQGDGSILVSGAGANGDIYTVSAVSTLDRIAAVRLEVLPDPSLPNKGPGRHSSGNFQLSAFRAFLGTNAGGRTPLPVESASASFDYKAPDADIAGTVDARLNQVWHVWGRVGEAHEAAFLVRDAGAGRDRLFIVELQHKPSPDASNLNLGRFRLSVSGDPAVFARERYCFAARKLTDPWARLAVAYHIVGDRQAVDKFVRQHPAAAVGIGDLYAADLNWQRAIAEYSKGLTDPPADGSLSEKLAVAHNNVGVAHARKGQWDEAIASYRAAVKLNTKRAIPYANLGLALSRKGEWDEAVVHYRAAVARDPRNAPMHLGLGQALLGARQYGEARKAMARAIELFPANDPARITVMLQAQASERLAKIEARLPLVLKGEDKPADNAERLDFAQLAHDHKHFAAAARLWGDALQADPNLADDRQKQLRYNAARAAAMAAAGQGHAEPPLDDAAKATLRRQAIDWFKAEQTAWAKLLESGPAQQRAIILQTMRNWQQDTELAGIRDNAALAKLAAEERTACVKLWADVAALRIKGEKMEKGEADAAMQLGQARDLARRREWKKAAQTYALVIDRSFPNWGEVAFEYATVLLLAGDEPGYKAICTRMAQRSGQIEVRPYHVARACTLAPDLVDFASAGKNAESELRINSREFWSLTEKGALTYRAGRYDEAATLFEQSLKADNRPGRSVLNWLWLALVEHRRGKPNDAQAWLNKATQCLTQYSTLPPGLEDEAAGWHLHNWLEAQILRLEAERVLLKQPDDKPK
jgi:serine/threonine protein kinase/Tfp pilus assembly protein PilF